MEIPDENMAPKIKNNFPFNRKTILKIPSFMHTSMEITNFKGLKGENSPVKIHRAITNIMDKSQKIKSSTDTPSNKNCMICYCNPANCVLMDCGHGGLFFLFDFLL